MDLRSPLRARVSELSGEDFRRAVRARPVAGGRVSRTLHEVPDEACAGTRAVGDSRNTVRGYCLDIPRFEESLNN